MKNFKLPLVLFLLLSFVSHIGLTQTQPDDIGPSSYEVQLIPANPEVASLGKFGDLPINKYNGTANIAIPIYSIDFEGLQIPLNLNYNTGGIRVNQEASWVGLGWSLSDGITITREINGFDDIRDAAYSTGKNNIGWIYTDDYMAAQPSLNYQFRILGADLAFLDNAFGNNTPYDLEPDVFMVNTPNGSCKFSLPKISGNETFLDAKVFNDKNFQVKYTIATRVFEVTDPRGFTYLFDKKELSTGFSSWDASPGTSTEESALDGMTTWSTNQTKNMITSWKPSKITSPFDKELTFSYTPGFYFSYPSFSESFEFEIVSGAQGGGVGYHNTELPVTTPTSMSASMNVFDNLYLNKIEGDFGSVTFNLSSDRLDLFSQEAFRVLSENTAWTAYVSTSTEVRRLDGVTVEDFNNNEILTANFSYSYFNDAKKNLADKERYIRLKLDNVVIQDQKYTFDYINSQSLPNKDSKGVDFWGFYNGLDQNPHRIPSSNRFYYSHPDAGNFNVPYEKFYKLPGVSRKSDACFGRYGALSKVIYPTGGSAEYLYEGNSVALQRAGYDPTTYPNGGFRSGINSSEAYNFRYQYLKLAEDPNYSLYDYSSCSVDSNSITTSGTSFQITDTSFCNGLDKNVQITATLACATGCNSGIEASGPAVWLENTATGQVYNIFHYDNQFTTTNSVLLTYSTILPLGNYKLFTYNDTTQQPAVFTASASLTYYQDNSALPDVNETFEVGGLRLFQVVNRQADGSFINSKQYDYSMNDDGGNPITSGKLMDDLVFTSRAGNWEYTPERYVLGVSGQELKPTIHSQNMLRTNNSASGSHVGYSQVIEKVVDASGNSNGSVQTNYTNLINERMNRDMSCTPQFYGPASGCQLTYNCWDGIQFCSDYDNVRPNYRLYYDEVYLLGGMAISNEHQNGNVLSEIVYDNTGNELTEVINEYIEYSPTGDLVPYFAVLNWVNPHYFPLGHPYQKFEGGVLKLNRLSRLKKSTNIQYLGGNSITSVRDFNYGFQHYFANKITTTNSKGELITSKAFYPEDLQTEPFMADLIAQNRVSDRIRTEIFKGTEALPEETLTLLQETTYNDGNNSASLVLPQEVKTLKGNETASNTKQLRQIYEQYDNEGNLLQYRSASGIPVSYIWGYKKMYPVAKVVNATYAQIEGILGIGFDLATNGLTETQANNLRSGLTSAQVTTFTYNPLIGVTSVTDPKGYTMKYTYDAVTNRLIEVRDDQDNLITDYEYKYVTIQQN